MENFSTLFLNSRSHDSKMIQLNPPRQNLPLHAVPFPLNPRLQAQLNDPIVSWQVAFGWHGFPRVHSFISKMTMQILVIIKGLKVTLYHVHFVLFLIKSILALYHNLHVKELYCSFHDTRISRFLPVYTAQICLQKKTLSSCISVALKHAN